MTYYSHEGKELIEHLEEVKNASLSTAGRSEILELASYFHDVGKTIGWFQKNRLNYAPENCDEWIYFRKNEHALPGAIFLLKNYGLSLDVLLASWLISAHHIGLIGGIKNITSKLSTSEFEGMLKDVGKLEKKEYVLKILDNAPKPQKKNKLSVEEITCILNYYGSVREAGLNDLFAIFTEQYRLLGHLMLADRFSAAGLLKDSHLLLKQLVEKSITLEKPVEHYYEILKGKLSSDKNLEINKWRSDVQERILKEYDKNSDIYLIDVPTGGGKTIASLLLALKILKEEEKTRIIYMLPYVSIIDQTYEVIKKLNEEVFDKKLDPNLSHYLANLDKEDEDDVHALGELIGELWDNGVLVTTYAKFWDMFVMFSKRGNPKVPFIENSVIILDEIQYIRYDYTNIFKEVLNKLKNVYNCKLIITTATSPLDKNSIPGIQRIPSESKAMPLKDRTKIHYIGDRIDEYSLIAELLKHQEKKLMVILNTIAYSYNIYSKLREEFSGNLFYLSSIVLPKFRNEIIRDFDCEGGILVSTQSIEAGVDIDCDVAYRELAPFESIIQIAGRVNRNGLKKQGIVKVFAWGKDSKTNTKNHNVESSEKDRISISRTLYGRPLINITKELLEKQKEFSESSYAHLLEHYWDRLSQRTDSHRNKFSSYLSNLEEILRSGRDAMSNGIYEFELIKEKKKDQLFFIFKEHESLLEKYSDIKNELKTSTYKDKLKLLKELKTIRTQLGQYSVEYDVTKLGANNLEQAPFGYNSYLVREGSSEWDALYDPSIKGLRIQPII